MTTHSPLPDASALEAGIIEDELPSRLSRVQDNVRNLLRNSRLGSVYSSPAVTATNRHDLENGLFAAPVSPTHGATRQQASVIPSPSVESVASTSPTATVPPSNYRNAVQQMAHQSAFFNSRALAALNHVNHPDLNHPSLATCLRKHQRVEERQRHAWKRSRNGQKRTAAIELGSSQSLLCIFAALMLAATVSTYIVLTTTSTAVTPTFHILFVLGIILATIVFAHSMIRLLLFNRRSRPVRKTVVVTSTQQHHRHRHRHHRRPRHHGHQTRMLPVVTLDTTAFVPPTPIPVHMPSEEVRPDTREARPLTTIEMSSQQPPRRSSWDKDVDTVPNPPPAYGRWRGSVRADPDLLHWQVVPSPAGAGTPTLLSPTYEEVVAEEGQTRPPSYVTRDSPAGRPGGGARPADDIEAGRPPAPTVENEPEPEMVEIHGMGFAV